MEGGEAKFNGQDWNTTPPGLVPVWIEGISKEKCRNLKRSKGSRCELLEWGNAFPVESCSRLAISRNKTSTRIPCFLLLRVCPREPRMMDRRKNHQLWVVEEEHVPPLLIFQASPLRMDHQLALACSCCTSMLCCTDTLVALAPRKEVAWLLHYDWLDI